MRHLLDRLLAGTPSGESPLGPVETIPQRPGRRAPWPGWAPDEVVAASARRGVSRPWTHQVEAADLAHAGRSVIVATGTASGKSLAYQLPALAALAAEPRGRVLYLS